MKIRFFPALVTVSALSLTPFMAQAADSAAPVPVGADTAAPENTRAENAAAVPVAAQAQDTASAPADFSETLTGDWGGLRTRLADKGLSLAAVYHADLWRNFSGGIKKGDSFLDDLDVQLSIDGDKLFGAPGLSAFIYLLNNDGSRVNENLVGSAGGIDSLEVAKARPKLYEAWVQQNFFDDRVSLLGGLYDLNTEFDVTNASLLFINPTYGMGTEFGTTGVAGPSTFPETSAGGRFIVKPVTNTYVEGAVLGGRSADPGDPNGLRMGFGPHAGLLLAGEAGYRNDDNGHYALGVWHYTERADEFTGVTDSGAPSRQANTGYYGLAERTLLTDPHNKDRKLNGFIRLGFADEDVSPYRYSWATGFSVTNVVPARPDSQFGFGVSQARIGGDYRQSLIVGGGRFGSTETQFEATYSDKLLPWLTAQPDLQYTVNPGMNKDLDNAWTAGLRLTANF